MFSGVCHTHWQAHKGSPPPGISVCGIFNIFHAPCIRVFVLWNPVACRFPGICAKALQKSVSSLSGSQEIPNLGGH